MESRTGLSTKEQIEQLMTRVDEMNEKLYEFETNKKNNLIFYGIPGEVRETPPVLMTKVRLNTLKESNNISQCFKVLTVVKRTLAMRRDVNVSVYIIVSYIVQLCML